MTEIRKIKKEITRKKGSILVRIKKCLDQALLSYYRKQLPKIAELEYKLEKPDHWEADQMVEMIEEELGKGRVRSEFMIVLAIIRHKQLGTRTEKAKELMESMEDICLLMGSS
jgi:hypothetical protein